jgi:hypothetical protein
VDEKKQTAPVWASGVRVHGSGLSLDSLRSLMRENPRDGFARAKDLIDKGEFTWSRVRDLRGLYDSLWGMQIEHRVPIAGRERAITSAAFPLLCGELSVSGINAAYMAIPDPTAGLVTEFEDNKKYSHIAELRPDSPGTEGVAEGDAYPLVSANERRYTIGHFNDGLRMAVTTQMIEENDIAGIVSQLNFIGETLAKRKAKRTIRRLCDYDGSKASPAPPYALTLNGTGAALYSATANTPGVEVPSGNRVNNNALVDETDLSNARIRLTTFIDSEGFPTASDVSSMVLLVPEALSAVAQKILGSELIPGEVNAMNPWGPRGAYRPTLIATRYLDQLSTSAWYLGDFARQFRRKIKRRLVNYTLGAEGQAYLERDIAFQARASEDCEVGAISFNQVVQCLSGTTAPADE